MVETSSGDVHGSPLSGNLYLRPDIEDYIGADDIDRITRFLQHDGSFTEPVRHAHGRNVTISLTESVGFYNAVQISGGAYIDMGITSNSDAQNGVVLMDPTKSKRMGRPAQTPQQFTHSYYVVQDGQLVRRSDQSPMGSYPKTLADRKLRLTERASHIEAQSTVLIAPIVLGKYEFEDLPDGQGNNATALLFAVPAGGERADTSLLSYLMTAARNDPEHIEAVLDEHTPPLMLTLSLLGRAAADIHAHGLAHNQLTMGNVLAFSVDKKYYLYVADWETATETAPEDASLTAAFELTAAFSSFASVIDEVESATRLTPKHKDEILKEACLVLWAGYARLPHERVRNFMAGNLELWLEAMEALSRPTGDAAHYEPIIDFTDHLVEYRRLLVAHYLGDTAADKK